MRATEKNEVLAAPFQAFRRHSSIFTDMPNSISVLESQSSLQFFNRKDWVAARDLNAAMGEHKVIPRLGWPPIRKAEVYFRFSKGLSVFFPAYNDAQSLPFLLARAITTLQRVADDYEVIVVNDGSVDDTAEVLEKQQVQYGPLLRVVTHDRNCGYGAALRSGLKAATKEYIFYTDGDGQYDPAEIESLLRVVTPETGLVNGYKMVRSDPPHRIVIGWLYNHFARWLFRIQLRDIDCDFRLIRRTILDPALLRSTGGAICVELVRQMELSGCEVIELPVRHYPRQYGSSQFFRVCSLASTFAQLCSLFGRLVLAPAFLKDRAAKPALGRGTDAKHDPDAVNFRNGTAGAGRTP